jgi:plasmid stability protein
MGALTIRNIDDAVVAAIKRRAGEHGISMEEEIRQLLASTYGSAEQAHPSRRQEVEQRRDALRDKLNDSIARGGFVTDQELDVALARKSASLAKDGF